jgi:HTH-type transcriptional regulator/antitoxin HipB
MAQYGRFAVKARYDDIMEWTITHWQRLGLAVRAARRAQKMTQANLAERAGVSRGWLVRFEHGLPNAEPRTVLRVLHALGLELALRPRTPTEEEALLEEVLGE